MTDPRKRGRWLRGVIGAVLVALLAGRWLADRTADRLWADSLGVGEAHSAIAGVRLMLLVLAFFSAALWCVGNVYLFYRSIGSVHVPRRVGNIEFLEAVPRRYLLAGAVAVGLLLAVVVSHDAGDWWTVQTLLGEGSSIETRDPILGRGLGYYLFVLPWYRILHGFATLLTGTMLAVITLLYAGVGAIRWTRRRLHVSELARLHLAGLFAAFALTLFWGYRLEPAEYVAGIHGVVLDATLIDVRIPVARLLSVLGLLAAGVSFAWLWFPSVGMMAAVWTLLGVVSVVGHYALPAFTASAREGEAAPPAGIQRATIEFQRIAFGLEPRDSTVTSAGPHDVRTLAALAPQLRAAPIWDAPQVTQALNALRVADAHVRFFDASLGLYRNSRGEPAPVYLSVREVDFARARDAGVLSWEREHTTPYGHSRGVVAVAAAAAAADGSALFLPSVAPGDSASPRLLDVRQPEPEIFFSPAAGGFAIVGGSAGEYVGARAGGILRRIALGWALQSPRLVTSDVLSPDVLILWERQIATRLTRFAPFAEFGTSYPVLAGGRLYWVASGYVAADAFPLVRSVPWRGRTVRFVRGGLVGVVDARSGATSVYLTPSADPVSTAWAKRLPEIIRPYKDLAPDIAEHVRYPEELFDVQVGLIRGPLAPVTPPAATGAPPARTGRLTAAELARRNRIWWVGPWARDTTTRLRVLARFESEESTQLSGLIQGTLVAGVPALEVIRFSQSVELASPTDLTKRLAETRPPVVGVGGPRRAVWLDQGVLAMQSSYATGDGAPRLADVILQWGPMIAHGTTLTAAIDEALKGPNDGGPGGDWTSARRWFERMEQARQRGDWTAFGRAYDALRRMLSGQ